MEELHPPNLGINCRTYISFNGSLSPTWRALKRVTQDYGPITMYNPGEQSIIQMTGWFDLKVNSIRFGSVGGYDSGGWATGTYRIEGDKIIVTLTGIEDGMARARYWITISGYTY